MIIVSSIENFQLFGVKELWRYDGILQLQEEEGPEKEEIISRSTSSNDPFAKKRMDQEVESSRIKAAILGAAGMSTTNFLTHSLIYIFPNTSILCHIQNKLYWKQCNILESIIL